MGDASYGFYTINHKMNNINGTQSSENESLKGDMSYLFGRDPSILAYGQRPFPSQESKRNLISLLEEEKEDDEYIETADKISTSADSSISQTIKVFLRMKPFPRKMKITQEQLEAYSILNPTTLLTKMPSLDNNTSCLKKIKVNDVVCRKFIFTQTFGSETSQLQLFEQAVKPQMVDFLAGKNSVVMSYGTTNSGKTYTLQGTAESPGIIPRGIEYVFSNVSPRAIPSYKPVNLCDVIYLSNQDRLQETDLKMKLLAFNPVDKNYHVTTYQQMQRLLEKESPMRPSQNYDAYYSVWISFAEIYNETVYDLLFHNDCQKKRPMLKLATDSKGRAFIKGLKSVCVSSGAEAYQVLMAGQYNLKVAATALNSRSSRSHCIFTIKLLKYRHEHDPYSVDVSMFAFCDLAGSERLKKTLNVGKRLKEAQNINTSLLVLGRCLKTIYESQCSSKQKNESIGPFRESKLTRLFQRALSGKEQIALIVNVNPVPNLYMETLNVLNFSAIAKKIVIESPKVVKRRHSRSRFSRLVTQNMKTDVDWENIELDDMTESSEECTEQETDIDENDQEAYEDLLIENEMLKKEIKELKASAFTREMQTRQEMTDMYSEIMQKLEADWKNRMIDMEEQHEDLRELAVERIELFYKEKLNELKSRKRSRQSDDNEDEDDQKLLEDLEIENTRLLAKIETMKKSIRDLRQIKEAIETEKTKISFELAVAKEEEKRANEMLEIAQKNIYNGDDVSANYIEELNGMLQKKDERIKTIKTFLNEAKEEYIFITSQAQKMEHQIKAQDELLAENMEQIRNLEEQLGQASTYSAEQSKLIENLEEELDQQTRKLIDTEEKVKSLSEQLQLALCSSESDKNKETPHQEVENEDYEKTKSLLEEMKLRFESSEKENIQLKEKLNQRVSEIQLLKNSLDSTKNQLDQVTEKVNSLTIEELEEEATKQAKTCVVVEQGIQTEGDDYLDKKLLDTMPNMANIICQTNEIEKSLNIAPNSGNISCQTNEIENSSVQTLEKSLQTSLCLNQSLNKKEAIEDVKTELVSMESFNELQQQYDEIKRILEECRTEKKEAQKQFEDNIQDLQTQITAFSAQEEIKNERICSLQKDLEQLLEKSEEERKDLNHSLETQDIRNKNLMETIAAALEREQDKDKEISTLQKEMKNLIQSNEEIVKKMEVEMKSVLRHHTTMKEELTKAEEKNRKLDNEYKQVIHILEMKIGTLEQKSLEKHVESEKLKLRIEELKKSIGDTEHELQVFTRNRNETVSKYEDLVKSQHEELERSKKEIAKFQDLLQEVKENTMYPTPFKGSTKKTRCNVREEKKKAQKLAADIDNTSEEDHYEDNQTEKSKKNKKEFLTPNKDNIPLIELSGSDSKRSVKSATKEAPPSCRRTRRKKLFTPLDDSYVDIEPGEPLPSPSSSTRNLRNRRK